MGGKLHPLIESLRTDLAISISSLGSVNVHWETMEAKYANCQDSSYIYCVGEFALGPNFVPSSIEGNLRMAKTAIQGVIESLPKSAHKHVNRGDSSFEVTQFAQSLCI